MGHVGRGDPGLRHIGPREHVCSGILPKGYSTIS